MESEEECFYQIGEDVKRDLRETESIRGATCWEDSLLAWDRQLFECSQCKHSPTAVPLQEVAQGFVQDILVPLYHTPFACTRWGPRTAAGPEPAQHAHSPWLQSQSRIVGNNMAWERTRMTGEGAMRK